MRWWFLPVSLVVLLAVGCSRPETPALQPGDVVRPEVSVAPRELWHAGDKVNVGVLLRGVRPNGEGYYVNDSDVEFDRVVMRARFTFLNGEQVIGEPLDVTLVHDC